MTSAALLPTPGDPFLLRHWLRNCELVWREEVDELRVLVGGQSDPAARAYIRHRVEALGGVYAERETGGLVPHGVALNILISDTDADVVVLLEDDVRVRSSGAIVRHVRGIDQGLYDVAASPRGSMTPGLAAAAVARWPRGRLEDGSEGHGMWPAFVFARRSDLLATDRDYGERSWGPGMHVPGLGYLVEGGPEVADTFGGTAFQLRDRLRVHDIPQWKCPWLTDAWLSGQNEKMSWFHVGSLSSSNNLGGFEPPVFQDGRTLTDPQEIGEWAHRLVWWRRCLRLHGHDLPEHAARYEANWERLRRRMGVPVERIDAWTGMLERLITWDEHDVDTG